MARGARRVVGWLVALALVAALSTGGVVLVLRALERAPQAATGCVAGESWLGLDEAANAALIAGAAVRRDLPARAATIGLATAMQESRLQNIDHGDRDSLGLFQQRPSQGWGTPEQVMDPHHATNLFYDHLVRVEDWTVLPVTQAAQAVQRSAFPDAYAQHETVARAFASALTGWSAESLSCTLPPPGRSVAGGTDAVVDRVRADLGLDPVVRAGTDGADDVVLEVTSADPTGPELDRLVWALAHHAVATASRTGSDRVAVGDRVWVAEDGVWRARAEGEPMPARGQVVVTVLGATTHDAPVD